MYPTMLFYEMLRCDISLSCSSLFSICLISCIIIKSFCGVLKPSLLSFTETVVLLNKQFPLSLTFSNSYNTNIGFVCEFWFLPFLTVSLLFFRYSVKLKFLHFKVVSRINNWRRLQWFLLSKIVNWSFQYLIGHIIVKLIVLVISS